MQQLTLIVTSQNRISAGLFLLVWIIGLYLLPNKFLLSTPTEVPLTMVDHMIPLTTFFWAWIYVSYYLYLITAYLTLHDEQNLNQIFYSFFVSAALASIIFFLYPTSISRDLYPMTEIKGSSEWVLQLIRYADKSVNCAPSMHIAMTTIAALSFLKESKKTGFVAVIWGLLIAYSTMATKQHYFIDVVGGFIFGGLTYSVFSRIRYVTSSSRIASN